LDWTRTCRTQFWKGTTQGPLWPSWVLIGPVVSEEKIFEWKVYDGRTMDGRRTQSDGKSSPRWAKKSRQGQICQIARMLKFIYPPQRAGGIMFLTSPRVVGNVFVSDSPLKLLNGISWNMVVFKDMTWRYAFLRTWHEDMRIDRKFWSDYFSRSCAPLNLENSKYILLKQFVIASSLKLLNGISWNLVVIMDIICRCA
jgi:hypothetical protein